MAGQQIRRLCAVARSTRLHDRAVFGVSLRKRVTVVLHEESPHAFGAVGIDCHSRACTLLHVRDQELMEPTVWKLEFIAVVAIDGSLHLNQRSL